jgi:FlaA1/EpsC-like NDP-sugar epimerase
LTDPPRCRLAGQTVLVTGAGGTVGAELARQALTAGAERVVLLGHGEHSLFLLQRELLATVTPAQAPVVVADVRSQARIGAVMRRYRPGVVFHAAAHKHVPMMETNVAEAITNNVEGTAVVLEAAVDAGARFVLLSTDKAVRPASVMGATKQVAEGLVRHRAVVGQHPAVAVRFGNVFGSRGSVVPLVRDEIRRGGPVALTDPRMRRYFISAERAAALLCAAAEQGRGGELFVTVMDPAIGLVALAEQLMAEAGRTVPVVFTGVRPGEKLDEEPFFSETETDPTDHPGLRLARDPVPGASWVDAVGQLVAAASREDPEEEARLYRLVRG